MSIDIMINETRDVYGATVGVQVFAQITHSPREGFDNEKLGQLETDLADFLTKRINNALRKAVTP